MGCWVIDELGEGQCFYNWVLCEIRLERLCYIMKKRVTLKLVERNPRVIQSMDYVIDGLYN